MFSDMVRGWFGGSAEPAYNNFIKALLLNDLDAMNDFMNKVALHSFSITSNRESGFGRYDVMLTPLDREKDDAYLIEFEVHKPLKEKNLAETVANALAQIDRKQYEAELAAKGFAAEKYGSMVHSGERNV